MNSCQEDSEDHTDWELEPEVGAEGSARNIKIRKQLIAVSQEDVMNRINNLERTCRSGRMEAGAGEFLTCLYLNKRRTVGEGRVRQAQGVPLQFCAEESE